MASIGFGPLERIDGPPPIPPLYGLLPAAAAPAGGVRFVIDTDEGASDANDLSSTGETIGEAVARMKAEGTLPSTPANERWLNGAEVYSYPADPAEIFDACAPASSSGGTKVDGGEIAHPQFAAITVYYAESCKSYKVWDQAAFIARATLTLAAVESAAIARHLMTGEGLPLNPHLADANATILNSGAATNAMNGLALLEKAIGETGRQGLVHCSPQFAEASSFGRLSLDNKTGVIRTINGVVIIPDFGYADGSKPDHGAAATGTQEWIYATGPIDIRRSEMFVKPDDVSEALDRGTAAGATLGKPNMITYRAERYYLVTWDTELQAAVLTDRCQAAC